MPQNFRELFNRACSEIYGSYEKLEIIEQRLVHLRSGEQITYADLKAIADDSLWPFIKFWSIPNEEQIAAKLPRTDGLFSKLQGNLEAIEKDVIKQLNEIFQDMGLVSIILRFVFPENYGIYSPPVLHVARIERGRNEVEDYHNYLTDLREILSISQISQFYGVQRVADVDMLLWAISHLGGEALEEFNSFYRSL